MAYLVPEQTGTAIVDEGAAIVVQRQCYSSTFPVFLQDLVRHPKNVGLAGV